MPSCRKDLGPDCQELSNETVSCLVCREASNGIVKVIQRHSWSKHCTSAEHTEAVCTRESRKAAAEARQRNYNEAYNAPAGSLELDREYIHASEGLSFTAEEQSQLFAPIDNNAIQKHNEDLLRQEFELLCLQANEVLDGQPEDASVPELAAEFMALGLDKEGEDEDMRKFLTGISTHEDYRPYKNKTTFLLDILDNLPRLRLSSSHMKMILWVMRNSNPKEVPSYKALREEQAQLRELCGIPSIQYKSQQGDIYYLNDVTDMLKKNFENPETAQHIMFYPEDTDGAPRSEFTQFARMREHPEQLTPSFRKGNKRFYVDELAMLSDVTPESARLIVGESEERISTNEFSMNLPEIIELTGSLKFAAQSASFSASMPNKYRELDKDEDHVVVWMPVWADDVSGARSKQYQKHVNVYMCNGSLPGKLVQQEYHVNFVGSSQQVSATEMLGSVMKQVESTHANPIRCYNAATGRYCRFRIQVPYLPADNPQQSEECSHIGHNGTFLCRVCHVGGTYAEKESDKGYEAFYNVGELRSAAETRNAILEQIRLASHGVASHVEAVRVASGAVDKTAEYWIPVLLSKSSEFKRKDPQRSVDDISAELLCWLSTQTKQPYNPLLDAKYLDPSQDTPVENLHTYLLGHKKYAWYDMHSSWDDSTQALFAIRLQIPKRFNRQTLQNAHANRRALSELGAALWIAEIDDLEQYLEDLEVWIDNVLDAWARIDPAKILKKIKLHLLKHLPAHIRRFGPSVRFSTEVFECFNAVFRMCSVLSNHQAPMVATGFEMVETERAGESVIALLHSTPILQRHLGWTPPRQMKPGSVQCPGREKRMLLAGKDTMAFNAVSTSVTVSPDSSWIIGTHVISQSEDVCPVGSWVIDRHFIARIIEILHSSKGNQTLDLVTLHEFTLSEALHHYYEMPVLHKPERHHLVVNSEVCDILFNELVLIFCIGRLFNSSSMFNMIVKRLGVAQQGLPDNVRNGWSQAKSSHALSMLQMMNNISSTPMPFIMLHD
ncbi:hypothetical protein BT96DRAFT_1006762 [Gymnopus androsaceus JB14]|uniref:Uncharacterized protein n=1 Tax=Gymnopus androsaceus JB14 TaxID=1447944 RepID=A0A6A4GJF9_9AGAR|nr:hypothetical protein BT96DRAFT_1006762 [Gymnopus androsaceus JB14]